MPRLGTTEVSTFGNSGMRAFAGSLNTPASPLSPKSINEIVMVVKQIIASAVNENGDKLYPRDWNHKFIDLPIVNKRDQKTPTLTSEQVTHAVRCSPRPIGAFLAMIAATGLRIGEAVAVRIGDDGLHTAWVPEKRLIIVRTQFWKGWEISPKTPAGYREIDLHSRINEILVEHAGDRKGFLFINSRGNRIQQDTVRQAHLKRLKIPGFHSFRRFRTTRLREIGCPEDIIQYWLGHEGSSITDRYSKLAQNMELRSGWSQRVGFGFDLWLENEVKK